MAIEKKRLQRGKRAEPGENPVSPEEATVAVEGKIFSHCRYRRFRRRAGSHRTVLQKDAAGQRHGVCHRAASRPYPAQFHAGDHVPPDEDAGTRGRGWYEGSTQLHLPDSARQEHGNTRTAPYTCRKSQNLAG